MAPSQPAAVLPSGHTADVAHGYRQVVWKCWLLTASTPGIAQQTTPGALTSHIRLGLSQGLRVQLWPSYI